MNQPPDTPPTEPSGPPPAHMGCGCALPTSGALLLGLTIALAVLIAKNTSGWSPLWLVLAPLILGIIILYGQFRVSGRKK